MTFTPILGLIIGAIVGLAVGWGIGFADSNLRTKKKIEAAEANAAIAINDAEKKIAEANRKLAEVPPPQVVTQTVTQDDPGLLRLKNDGGYYALEMDGAPIRSALGADGKKRLIELLTVIRPYLEGALPPQATPAPAAPARPPAPVAPAAPPKVAPPVQAAPRPAEPTPAAPAAPVEQKPMVNPSDKKAMAKLSMIGQIDAVLQWRLLSSPLATRGIRVSEAPGGSVQVDVGLEKFDAIDDVTDPEVKAFIRACVAEWEEKFTPGL